MKHQKGLKGIFKLAAAAAIAAPLAFSASAMAQTNSAHDQQTPKMTQLQQDSTVATAQPESDKDVLTYINPWVLLGGVSLPLLLLLMRLNPPPPTSVPYSPVHLLSKTKPKDESPKQIPWWLRQLRLTAGALALVAMAQPLLNPEQPLEGEGPLLLVVDNGWTSAENWQARKAAMGSLIDRAERESRQIILLSTARPGDDTAIRASTPLSASEARNAAMTLEPMPWPADREAALTAIDNIQLGTASVVWLSNSLSDTGSAALAERLKRFGALTVFEDPAADLPHLLVPPDHNGGELSVKIRKPLASEQPETISLIARAEDGRIVHRVEASFAAGETKAVATFKLPAELRNELTQIAIDGENTAGAVVLLEERWRPVGLLDNSAPEEALGPLSEFYYVERALEPYVDLRRGSIDDMLARDLSVMVMTDKAVIDRSANEKVDSWIRKGGTLLRFAGPRLAAAQDNLLPVRLRPGERNTGGTMAWSEPARVAPFDKSSPFYGLELPEDVVIERQVLAQPGVEANERAWASLEDGTPLVTAEKRGEGWLILVHTTANSDWSNLAFSGLFVDMLRTVIAQSEGVPTGADNGKSLAPLQTLDARGQLGAPASGARPLTNESLKTGKVGPRTPPGFYGDDTIRHAHNLASAVTDFKALANLPEGTQKASYANNNEQDLTGPLLGGALALFLLDTLVMLGHRRRRDPAETKPKPQTNAKPR